MVFVLQGHVLLKHCRKAAPLKCDKCTRCFVSPGVCVCVYRVCVVWCVHACEGGRCVSMKNFADLVAGGVTMAFTLCVFCSKNINDTQHAVGLNRMRLLGLVQT